MVAHDPAEAMTFAALSIAGSDSSGGAGIQADLAAFNAAGVHGATAITAVTAQNYAGVRAVQLMPPALVRMQIEAAFDERAVHAVKLGMLGNAGIVETVAATLRQHRPRWLVIDPVMIASSGARLLDADAIGSVRRRLLPLADCLVPNLDEAAVLLDMPRACSETEMLAQGRALLALGARAVLMKGGHAPLPEAVDLLVTTEGSRRYAAPWIKDIDTHGTGCTLSAAITAGLARGLALVEAIDAAKRHLGVWLGGRLSRA
ncbi:bifunctional hydroxymethylpyrimidine kinase/phosphomethylpyrimidine kinase [Thermomonas paludicola]|uniref:bifunctional hydroxymethylpyrimidine kinase/phosphomethylpyrimidine kinase n=1 Tax=Thermomonas paludicola TaxID=2884874 RepID=UPI00211390D9|nr:bifunctional hydroxymethylpyrimidine kinase/phosphomethylpyrimidine kinase [Thermomonas paludicola]